MRATSRADEAFERFRSSGDPEALARCFDLTSGELGRLARHLVRGRDQAEDLLQATYLTAIERRADFRPGEPVLPWLVGILANRARATRKRESRRPALERTRAPAEEPDPVDVAAWEETSETLRATLRGFPSPYREVVTLHLLQGMNAREIAAALGTPAGTVRTQIVRGLERLRGRLPAGISLRGFLVFAFSRPARLRLGSVRRAVLARSGAGLQLGLGSPLVGGILLVKPLLLALGLGLSVGVGWLFFPLERESVPPVPDGAPPTARKGPIPGRSIDGRPALAVRRDATDVATGLVETGPARLLVRVRDSRDRPIAGAGVRLLGAENQAHPELGERRLWTDAAGAARAADLPVGTWSVVADRASAEQSVRVERGATTEVDLVLPAGVLVTGSIRDTSGRAVPWAHVWLSNSPGDPNQGIEVARADGTGRFQVPDVEPGRLVAARAAGHLDSVCRVVERAATQEIELVLVLGSEALRGRVVDERGTPVVGAAVMSGYVASPGRAPAPFPERPGKRTWTDESGSFALEGPPGPTPLWVGALGFAPWHGQVERGGGQAELTIVLGRGATIRGSVHDSDGRTLPQLEIEVFHFGLEPRAGAAFAGPDWARPRVSTDAAGAFRIAGLSAGRVRLIAEHEGRLASETFDLLEGDEARWNAVLAVPERIEGQVVDEAGRPLAGWTVWGRADERDAQQPARVQTDAGGAFVLEPCDDRPHTVQVRDPGSRMMRPACERAGVRPGRPIEIVVPRDARASAGLVGTLVAPGDTALENVSITLEELDPTRALMAAFGQPVLEGQRFRLEGLLPGRYRVQLLANDLGLELGEIELLAERFHDLGRIPLPEPGWLELEVTGPSGEPLPEGRFLVRAPGSSRAGDFLNVVGGRARSRPLAPGTLEVVPFGGRLPLLRRELEVRSGETSVVSIRLPGAVMRRFRYPPMRDGEHVRETWTNGANEVVLSGLGTYPGDSGALVERLLAPDVYSIELSFEGTTPRTLTLRVDAGEDLTEHVLPDSR